MSSAAQNSVTAAELSAKIARLRAEAEARKTEAPLTAAPAPENAAPTPPPAPVVLPKKTRSRASKPVPPPPVAEPVAPFNPAVAQLQSQVQDRLEDAFDARIEAAAVESDGLYTQPEDGGSDGDDVESNADDFEAELAAAQERIEALRLASPPRPEPVKRGRGRPRKSAAAPVAPPAEPRAVPVVSFAEPPPPPASDAATEILAAAEKERLAARKDHMLDAITRARQTRRFVKLQLPEVDNSWPIDEIERLYKIMMRFMQIGKGPGHVQRLFDSFWRTAEGRTRLARMQNPEFPNLGPLHQAYEMLAEDWDALAEEFWVLYGHWLDGGIWWRLAMTTFQTVQVSIASVGLQQELNGVRGPPAFPPKAPF